MHRNTRHGTPLLSVVMPVHNGLPFLDESISSIVNQTFSAFEFVILDDGSTDDSRRVLRAWEQKDPRIRIYTTDHKLGLAGSANLVVSKARSAIVARMDADDISHVDRLRRQWNIMESAPDVAAIGTLCNGIDGCGRVVRPRDRWRLVRRSGYIPFPHGSAMFRRSLFDRIGGYNQDAVHGEDQDLFSRMTAHGRVLTLPDILYSYRYHSSNATLFNGARAVGENHNQNGNGLAAFYMLGAMRLWAGDPPMLLKPLFEKQSLQWNYKTLMILASALWGHVSPPTLRGFLRTSIRARDLVASIRIKDGRAYEWRAD